ncbi:hypothetical protein [Paraburkholderia sp. BCC1886]|uniref:hypothetical protein n=1 Tax=Paraburkholderia sp. BCC1886 TaxID=2562670 RepID=UPI001642DE69|nr:hypothetical protein [Paraburkholderia sp. BCC1886]
MKQSPDAFTASNADLYNRSTSNGDGQGSTANSALGWIGDQLASAGRGAENLANQFAALVIANGPQGPYVDPGDLNGPGGNSKPPAAGGSAALVPVCAVPPMCAAVPVVTPGTPGYVPSGTTLNSRNGDGGSIGDEASTFWSSTKDKTPAENAYGHSTKHGDEFPQYQNSVQYVQAAQDFVENPPDGTLTKTRPNGDTLYYDPATNTFASKTKDGAPKTMFKPSAGMEYWNRQ